MRAVMLGLILLSGCSIGDNHRRVIYVRDSSHHCRLAKHFSSHKVWDSSTGGIGTTKGWSMWNCDDVDISFDDDEEQP